MKPLKSAGRCIFGFALISCLVGPLLVPSTTAAQQEYFVKPVTEKRLKELPVGPLYWRVENFPTLAEAQTAGSPTSLTAEVAGKVWLFTLGPKGAMTGGTNAIEIGPVAPINAPEYLLRINYAGGPPGARTAVHTHPGSETFYVLSGQLAQRTPQGEMHVEAGQAMAGHAPGTPMEVSSSGTSELTALVMFVVDLTKPFSSPAKFE